MMHPLLAAGAAALLATACAQERSADAGASEADHETGSSPHSDAAPAPAEPRALAKATQPDRSAFLAEAAKVSAATADGAGKVANVASAMSDSAKGAMKAVAVADDTLKSPVASDEDFMALRGDAARGERLYSQCRACHGLSADERRAGPHLAGIVGRAAGAVEGFAYSPANRDAGIVWTRDALFGFLEDPQNYMPGTRMYFPGVASAQDRADLVAYLATIPD